MLAYLFRYRHELPLFLDHLAVPQANVRQHRVAAQPVKVGFFGNQNSTVLSTVAVQYPVLLRGRY